MSENLLKRIRKRQTTNFKQKNYELLKQLTTYKAYATDCGKIDPEALPAGIEFHPSSNEDLLLVADDHGSVSVVDVELSGKRNRQMLRHQWRAHKCAVQDICWLIDGEGILVASADHSITLWKNQTLVSTFQSSDDSGSVRCLAPNPLNQNVFAAGGRDCDICIFDMRERRRVGATNRILPSRHVELVHFPQKSQRNQDTPQRYRRSTVHHHRSPYLTGQDKTVSSAIFINEHELYTCGMVDHTVKLWDIRKLRDSKDAKCTNHSPSGRGFHSLTASQSSVFASCLDGSIYEFNIGSDKKPRRAFRGHVMDCNGSNHVKLRISPDEKFLIIGSTDGHPRIYPTSNKILKNKDEIFINNPGASVGRNDGTEPVMFTGWSRNGRIGLASDDGTVAIYKSDFDPLRISQKSDEHIFGSIKEDSLTISYDHCQSGDDDYLSNEPLSEINSRFSSLKVGPSRLCPWRHFGQKRKFSPDLEESTPVKNPDKKPRRIVLKQMNRAGVRKKPVGITAYFSPKPKS